ncbi:calcium-binding EGF domain-containing protein [Ditylenchus destructor]|uniref:Calcium-binding EGF domain-containing protein n=1 Tax=Ditylenchus destructor TaxID=166010 RepID=A0AAD4N9W0_9BILA|nr:calcium-binding EGF domain-containing protein [Ditylenchus destructor]
MSSFGDTTSPFTGQCRKCTFEDEAAVMLCSRELISEHYELNTNAENGTEHQFSMDLAKVGKICGKYENFVECARNVSVSRKCRSRSLPNLVSLWEFVCADDFRKQVGDEQSCYKAMARDPSVKRCVGNNTVDISQVRHNGGDQFCQSAQSTLECYKEFDHLEKCIQAVKLERNLYEFLIQNFSSSSTAEEGSPSCEFIEIDVLMNKFETMKKEKAIGGCDETGACKCIEGYTINNETMKCVDVDECDTGTYECSQKCTNTEGGYKCSCDDQYYSLASPQSNHSCIRSNDSAPVWLIFAHGQSIWNVSDDGKFVELKLAGLEKTAMLDVNVKVRDLLR